MKRLIIIGILLLSGVAAMAYEEPEYELLRASDEYEIRRYAPYIVAEVDVSGSFRSAGNKAFRILAGYIFGDNQPQAKMNMTVPVESKAIGENGASIGPVESKAIGENGASIGPEESKAIGENEASTGTVESVDKGQKMNMTVPVESRAAENGDETTYTYAFVMERAYTMETLPKPDDERVRLVLRPAKVMAVRPWTGSARESRYEKEKAALLGALESDAVTVVGTPAFARFNGPFTPWFMKRNEIHVEIEYVE
ncbi:MAG: heme-binding protein [Woeseiaceae bacterium]|nr:heme-binding protein [Woeseiaceae bacterium]